MSRKSHRPPPRVIYDVTGTKKEEQELEAGTIRDSVRRAQVTLDFLEQSVQDLERRVQRPPLEEAKAGGVGQVPGGPRSSIAGDIDALELGISRLSHRVRHVADAI